MTKEGFLKQKSAATPFGGKGALSCLMIGDALKTLYAPVIREDVPDRFMDLLNRLEDAHTN